MQSQPDNTLRISSTVKSHSALEPEPQLLLRLMARVGPDSRPDAGPPPQRGLYREVLDLALSTAKHFVTAYGRTVSAKEVHHAACALYFRANQAGLVPVSVARLAQDARMDRKTMARALTVCASLHIARPIRERRQGRVVGFALNVGGLDWPAVYARVRAMFPPSATTVPGASQPALGFPPEPVEKGPQAPSASAEKGPQAPSASAEKGPQAPSASAEKGPQPLPRRGPRPHLPPPRRGPRPHTGLRTYEGTYRILLLLLVPLYRKRIPYSTTPNSSSSYSNRPRRRPSANNAVSKDSSRRLPLGVAISASPSTNRPTGSGLRPGRSTSKSSRNVQTGWRTS